MRLSGGGGGPAAQRRSCGWIEARHAMDGVPRHGWRFAGGGMDATRPQNKNSAEPWMVQLRSGVAASSMQCEFALAASRRLLAELEEVGWDLPSQFADHL
jgi:hypothetical protein